MVGGRRTGAGEKSDTANRQRLQAHQPFLCDPKAAKTRCLRTLFISSASFVPRSHLLHPKPVFRHPRRECTDTLSSAAVLRPADPLTAHS